MEHLSVLEKKIALLIESKKNDARRLQDVTSELETFREESVRLAAQLEELKKTSESERIKLLEENARLNARAEKLEDTILTGKQNVEALSQERELTKMAVDDLIKDIDSIVNPESQQ